MQGRDGPFTLCWDQIIKIKLDIMYVANSTVNNVGINNHMHSATLAHTTGLGVFVESINPLGEGWFTHGGAFTESLLSAMRSRRPAAGEGPFDESRGSPSRWMCAERPQ
jgi:hypothetical protein